MNQTPTASPLGKAMVALAVLVAIGGSVYFIMNPGKSLPPAAKPAAPQAAEPKPAGDKPAGDKPAVESPAESKPQESKAAEPGPVPSDAK